jgi:hypothetical protein
MQEKWEGISQFKVLQELSRRAEENDLDDLVAILKVNNFNPACGNLDILLISCSVFRHTYFRRRV